MIENRLDNFTKYNTIHLQLIYHPTYRKKQRQSCTAALPPLSFAILYNPIKYGHMVSQTEG